MIPDTLYLDLETTGLSPEYDEILQIAILHDPDEAPLLHTYVRPEQVEAWPRAEQINGIRPDMVSRAPRLEELRECIAQIILGRDLVIYNAPFDCGFLPKETEGAASVHCAMRAFMQETGNSRAVRLGQAARFVRYEMGQEAHTALGDVRATRAIWRYLQVREERDRINRIREERP